MSIHLLCKISISTLIMCVTYAGTYSGGSGTSETPYQIANLNDLIELCQTSGDWNKYFIQTANIDASTTQYWDDADDNSNGDLYDDTNDGTSTGNNEGFSPIGNSTTSFTGSFDGQIYTIDGLYADRLSSNYIALFGNTNNSSISNVGLTNIDITGNGYVAGLAGLSNASTTISNSFCTGTVYGYAYVGGFVGAMWSSSIVKDCYATSGVSGRDHSGGLAGYVWSSTIDNCFASGGLSGAGDVGGLVAYNLSGTVTNSFWDTQTSTTSSSSGGTGKTSAQMKTLATFSDENTTGLSTAWDFETNPNDDAADNNYWDIDLSGTINGGYPFLAWQNGTDTSLPVEMSSFTAKALMNGEILVEWTTQSETENMGFILDRKTKSSLEGNTWKQIAQYATSDELVGQGSSTSPTMYSFVDKITEPSVTYSYRLHDVDYRGNMTTHYPSSRDVEIQLPVLSQLISAFPNPFNPATSIKFELNQTTEVRLTIYDLRGRFVAELEKGMKSSGVHETSWNGMDQNLQNVGAGIFFARLDVIQPDMTHHEVLKLMLLR